jgi:Ca-activated chloride channel family protein
MQAAAVLLTLAAAGAAVAQQTFRAGVDLVTFSVVVTDREGTPITGLDASDFAVVEQGRPQTIAYFAAGDVSEADTLGLERPLHLGLALDTSGSMEEDIADVRTASIRFLNANEHAADVTLVDFDTEVRLARFASADYPRLIERIRMRRPDGWTAFYDALGIYLHGAEEQTGDKVLLVYTDGGDTRSSLTYNDVLDLLRVSDVTLYTVGYLDHQLTATRMQQRMQLQHLAEVTGGEAMFPTSLKQLDKMYEAIQRHIASRYTIGYVSTDARMDGNWRKVEIRLTRPDLKGVRIRTRAGDSAPYRPEGRH